MVCFKSGKNINFWRGLEDLEVWHKMLAYFYDMKEVQSRDLVVGRRYRVEHNRRLLATRVCSFTQNFHTSIGIQSQFNNIIRGDGVREQPFTCGTYMKSEWRFYESGLSLMAEQVARGLCDRIPEDVAGVIERFLTAKAPMVDRYPERSK